MDVETRRPPVSESWTRWEGQSVNGAFPLRRCLGSSDHSGVFLTGYAEQNLPNVALKLVPAIPTLAESQLSHWGAAASLAHPNLIRLLETGRCQLGGSHYLYVVMDYAEQNLGQLLQHRALSEAEVREMLPLTLDALAFLHSRDLVQGQLKPSNVLVVGNQLALASDTIHPADDATASIGMLSIHNPPEARDGSFSTAGDIWALGVTLCQALTQRAPLRSAERPDLVVLPQGIPAAFGDILRRCLLRNPAERPSVADLQEWLRKGPAAEAVSAPVTTDAGAAAAVPATRKSNRSEAPQRLVIRAVIDREPAPPRPVERRSFVPLIIGAVAVAAVGWGAVSWYRGPADRAREHSSAEVSSPSEQSTSGADGPSPGAAAGAAGQARSFTPSGSQASRGSPAGSPPAATSTPRSGSSGSASVPSARSSPDTTSPPAGRAGHGSMVTSVVHEDIPSVSPRARATIHGHVKVTVRVTIDNSGAVVSETFVREGPSAYFARLSRESARRWRFAPGGGSGSRQSLIRFDFSRSGTTAHVVSAE